MSKKTSELGEQMQQAMHRLVISHERLSELTGIPVRTLQSYTGKEQRKPKYDRFVLIAKHLKL